MSKHKTDREKIEDYYNIRINDNIPSLPQAIVNGKKAINPRQSTRIIFSIDSFWVNRFVFDHEPTLDEIQTAHFIENFRGITKRYGWQEVYADGKHWTELDGNSVNEKLSIFFDAKDCLSPFSFIDEDQDIGPK